MSALARRFDLHLPPELDVTAAAGSGHGAAPPEDGVDGPERIGDRTLLQGSLIPAVLAEPASTDEPGLVTAYVQSDVFDSLTGTQLLIPAGTRAIGRVAGLSDADRAVEIAWGRLVLPDGRDLRIDASLTDRDGAGARGRRRTHGLQKVGAVLTSALTAAAVQLAQRPQSTSTSGFFSPGQIAAEEASRGAGRILEPWAQKQLARPPSVLLPIGAPVRLKVEQDLEIPPLPQSHRSFAPNLSKD